MWCVCVHIQACVCTCVYPPWECVPHWELAIRWLLPPGMHRATASSSAGLRLPPQTLSPTRPLNYPLHPFCRLLFLTRWFVHTNTHTRVCTVCVCCPSSPSSTEVNVLVSRTPQSLNRPSWIRVSPCPNSGPCGGVPSWAVAHDHSLSPFARLVLGVWEASLLGVRKGPPSS